jgi:dolichyl-phosphate-mannose--protein O-mannosyl transferase
VDEYFSNDQTVPDCDDIHADRNDHLVKIPRESALFSTSAGSSLISVILFLAAHAVLLIGLTTPDKFVFDEVHYVPAARQMLEPVMPQPMLNPMHPPLAKQMIALSIRAFGDNPLGWRYAGALFGALAIVAVYLCALALFANQARAVAAASIAFFNQMLFVMARTAMLDIFALTFALFGIAAFLFGFRRTRPQHCFALSGLAFGFSAACKWSGLFPLATCIVIVVLIKLLQSWRAQFADAQPSDWYSPDLWSDFRIRDFALCFLLAPALTYLSSFVALYGFSLFDIIEAQRRIFADNTTTTLGGHTYMSSWPSWPFLVRPVWFLFDNLGNGAISAVVCLGNPLVLWPALLALIVCARDFVVARQRDAFLVLAFYAGPYLAWALLPRTLGFIYYYLPSATTASLVLVYAFGRGGMKRWWLWAFVGVGAAGFAVMLPMSAAFIGTSMAAFQRLVIFQNWI